MRGGRSSGEPARERGRRWGLGDRCGSGLGQALRAGIVAAFVLVPLLLPALASPPAALAQEPLDQVERLVDGSRYGEARELLQGWWEDSGPTAARRDLQRGLWLRAILTVDPVMAEMDYRRLVVEFPGGEWSDEALLRLARGAQLMGDVAAARRYLEILIQDYSGSPHRVEARTLLDRLAALPADAGAPPPLVADPPAVPDPSVPPPLPVDTTAPPEIVAPPDTVGLADTVALPDTAAPPEAEPPAEEHRDQEPGGPFAVQLGAFSNPEGARALAAQARERGLEPRLVRVEGSDLVRVRVGGFSSAEEAEAEVARIRALGLEALVSTDRNRERPAG